MKVLLVVPQQSWPLFSKQPTWPFTRRQMVKKEMREALAELHGQELTGDHFIMGNGGLEILDFVARGFLKEGDEVIIPRPSFRYMSIAATKVGAKAVHVDLDPESYEYDMDAILAAINEKTRAIYLCNPNNPTGNVIGPEAMAYLMANVPEHIFVVADEAYSNFC